MAKLTKQLLLTIERAGKITRRQLTYEKRFTIGKDRGNDIILYEEKYPERFILFAKRNNHFRIHVKKFMSGEVQAGDSRLSFRDLILHGLLPAKNGSFFYPLTQDKWGFVVVGDVKISFQFVDADSRDTTRAELRKFKGPFLLPSPFKYGASELKGAYRKYHSRALVIAAVIHLAGIGLYWSIAGVQKEKPRVRTVQIVKYSELAPPPSIAPTSSGIGIREGGGEKGGQGGGGTRAETPSVLGLLTGISVGNQSDLLLNKGLVKELDAVMSNSELHLGGGGNSKGKGDHDPGLDLDNLLSTGTGGSGIDDVLKGVDGVESVSLGEKSQIQLDQIGGMKGSSAALGKRSEDSVRQVMLSYTGRLTYIYNKYLKHNPELRGKLVVEVVIAADGSVSTVKIVSSNMNHPEFEREVVNFIRKWKYEPIDEGTVTVSYPLFFNKIG